MKNIEKLPSVITGSGEVKGFIYEQMERRKKSYMYRVINTSDGQEHYEVFKRKHSAKIIDFENRIYSETEFKDIYPKANSFGVWAWTTSDVNKAYDYLHNIENQEDIKAIVEGELNPPSPNTNLKKAKEDYDTTKEKTNGADRLD